MTTKESPVGRTDSDMLSRFSFSLLVQHPHFTDGRLTWKLTWTIDIPKLCLKLDRLEKRELGRLGSSSPVATHLKNWINHTILFIVYRVYGGSKNNYISIPNRDENNVFPFSNFTPLALHTDETKICITLIPEISSKILIKQGQGCLTVTFYVILIIFSVKLNRAFSRFYHRGKCFEHLSHQPSW
jgi:hypothetical protein